MEEAQYMQQFMVIGTETQLMAVACESIVAKMQRVELA